VREDEIKRLQKLYEGGQSLEVLSVKYTHETNEKTITKLANQVDFLNRENHSLQQQVAILRGDSKAIKTIESFETQIKDLAFENETLHKDIAESARLIKDYQEKEMLMRERNLAIIEEEETINKKLEDRVAQMSVEQDRLKGEQTRMTQVRAAYNADKRALSERIQELESALRQREFDRQELEAKVNLLEQSAGQYRNEINFWNGKCSTLRRDVEYQERHLQRYKDENTKLINETDYLKVRAENMEREVTLLRR